ncbi:hypothetical protein LUZ60_002680 [Juncus effusus]|nr:hypothetical protein LUZ60_002680 [Juncus effusus]
MGSFGKVGREDESGIMEGERNMAAVNNGKASRSHSEAERKRRQRINGHLATLRSLLPSASRMDKAALLGEVVRHVRELRCKADAMKAGLLIPNEGDEVLVEPELENSESEQEEDQTKRIKAWVSCPDRAGLMSDLSRAVRSVRAQAVRAEIATVAGRTRSVLEVEVEGEEKVGRLALQSALRTVVFFNRDGISGLIGENYKRARITRR